MKRNLQTEREARRKARETQGTSGNHSKYARKTRAGNQMYGTGRASDGCCGHRRDTSHVRYRNVRDSQWED